MTVGRGIHPSRLLVAASATLAICTACGSVDLSPAPTGERLLTTRSASPLAAGTPTGSAPPTSTPVAPAPTTTPSSEPGPPYRIIGTTEQLPGTIIFGWIEDGALDPFAGWPDATLPIEANFAFGAYWGEPVRAPSIRITLYRIKHGVLELVWTDSKAVKGTATGYLDSIVPFRETGLYRLEVTRGSEPIAWALTRMVPPCEGDACSGG